jgi:hypothetical protein
MRRSFNFVFASFILLALSGEMASQTNTNSPYSRFGLGDLEPQGFIRNQAMGGISLGIRNPQYLDYINPASFAARDTLSYVFEFGLQGKSYARKTNTASSTATDINLRHIAMGFPITRWMGASIGIVPYSTMGYSIRQLETVPGIGDLEYSSTGEGGLSRFFIGSGIKLGNFALGANMSYLFGNIQRATSVVNPDDNTFARTNSIYNTNIGDFMFSFGGQYTLNLEDDLSLTLGGVFENQTELKVTQSILHESLLLVGEGYAVDTISFNEGIRSTVRYPTTYGLGISVLKKDKIMAGIDFLHQDWSGSGTAGITDSLVNTNSYLIGVEYIPNRNALNNYLATVHYRAGLRYSNTYLQVNNQQINDFGITFGVGLPLGRTRTTFNLAFQYGQRGSLENDLIKENYGIFSFSLSLYDFWFIKRKFD